MNHFQRRRGVLHAEDIPLDELARAYGTPLYVYSTATLTRHWKVLERSLRGMPHLLCYAVKANSNLAVLSLFARLGSGFDIVSAGELYRVLKAGGEPGKVVFSGVGKRDDEIAFALDQGVKVLDVESAEELGRVSVVARRLKRRAPIALRVNPAVDPKTHPYIATGLRESKFGVSVEEARRLYALAAGDPALQVKGVAMHIGSQITELGPFVDAIARVRGLVRDLAREGIHLAHLDVGGGLGIPYGGEEPPHPDVYGAAVKKALRGFDGEVLLEPGRVLVGNAGVLVTRVLYRKRNGRREFVVVDAGMNDLVRPALYGAQHAIEPVARPREDEIVADVVGPVCESSDFLAQRRRLPEVNGGELLCVRSAGAYGFAMSSSYNARPRAAEVLVDGDVARLARRRETFADLTRGEQASPPARRFGTRRPIG
ncbi:diaminopimelate decarboxylase [Anaeromyxobacter diazotrophicus]|uniref:Diaminopimelate decarboxylase n=1 Tax=Anaeromyxobacter diazotrophicus TaxID=2590199 RepID=A0A7I9VTR4_9BACT|nr:diaminopimelate decarboxylase [Anaeromyxobacter diazotrophicus]GEJ59357.1 diaminopimelate decarboxylase [Anaeromyxobacter diazotrophicus]